MKKKYIYTVASTIVVVSLVAVGVATYNTNKPAPVSPPAAVQAVTHPNVEEVFTLVNAERVKAGLSPLVDDPRLDASAEAKCEDMLAKDYRAHIAPDGTVWSSFIKAQVGINYRHIGENLSEYYKTSKGAVDGWMGSLEHKKNILTADYTNVGYAVCGTTNDDNYIVQHFLG